jgi:hypothetical protein
VTCSERLQAGSRDRCYPSRHSGVEWLEEDRHLYPAMEHFLLDLRGIPTTMRDGGPYLKIAISHPFVT